MTKLSTLNKRRKRKLFGVKFPQSALRRLLLCNRFAATTEGKSRIFSKNEPWERQYFNEEFYSIKDMILARFGKLKGYALQHWTTTAYDYDHWDGDSTSSKDGAHHYHILECIKIGSRVLHRPTGHFSFSNDLNGYYKETVGFDEAAKKCTQKIEGRKKITNCTITKREAIRAMNWLTRRFVYTYKLTPVDRPRLKTKTGNYEGDYYHEVFIAAQKERLEKLKVTPAMCAWCLQTFTKADLTDFAGKEFCNDCLPKVTRVERRASVGATNEIPF